MRLAAGSESPRVPSYAIGDPLLQPLSPAYRKEAARKTKSPVGLFDYGHRQSWRTCQLTRVSILTLGMNRSGVRPSVRPFDRLSVPSTDSSYGGGGFAVERPVGMRCHAVFYISKFGKKSFVKFFVLGPTPHPCTDVNDIWVDDFSTPNINLINAARVAKNLNPPEKYRACASRSASGNKCK